MKLKRDFHRLWLIPIVIMLFGIGFTCGFKLMPLVFASSAAGESTEEFFITVIIGDQKTIVKTSAPTVRELLTRLNVDFSDYDHIEPSLDSPLNAENFYVSVAYARPVLLQDGNTTRYLLSSAVTPRAIYEEAGITVYDDDEISTVNNNQLLEIGLATVYNIKRGASYAAAQAEAEAAAAQKAAAAAEAAAASAAAAAAAARPSIRPEWSACAAWVREAGVSEDDLPYALTLIYHESGCRYDAKNSKSGAYGIPQALPGNKMASIADDWQTNPITQIRWMAQYVTGRYGGWQQALDFWNSRHWY